MDADVISIEASRKRNNMDLLQAFVDFKYPSAIGPGVYDIHSPRVPGLEEILERLEQALRFIAPTLVNPDCGLKTRGCLKRAAFAWQHGTGRAGPPRGILGHANKVT